MVGWTAAVLVLAGILTAWMDPPCTGLINAGMLLLAAAWALCALFRRVPIPVHWIAILPLACAAWGVGQLAANRTVYSFETWNSSSVWLTRAVLFSAAYAGFRDRVACDRLKSVAVWFGGAFALFALLQWHAGGGNILGLIQTPYTSQMAGTFANRDHFSALMELLLPVALAATVRGGGSPLKPAICAGIMFGSVVACASRAGTLLVGIEVLVFLGLVCFGKHRNYRAGGLIVASLLICTLVGGWSYVWERFASSSDLFAARREMLTATIDMIRAQPLTGFGLGAWPTVYPAFAVFDPPGIYMNHAHNDWAEWAAEGGLPFLAIMTAFGAALLLYTRANLWALGIPIVLVHAIVDFPFQKPAIAAAVFFLAGAAVASRDHTKSATASGGSDSCELPLP